MLGLNYRFQVLNGGGTNVTTTVKAKAWKFDDYAASEIIHINAGVMSAGGVTTSSPIANGTDKYLFADIVWSIVPSGAISGVVILLLQRSTDGGTTWPDNGRGERLDSAPFTASSAATVRNARLR